MSVELTKKVAKELGLEIDWVEEINFATFSQDLKNGRFDMVCGDLFILPRGGQVDYTDPYLFVSVNGYVKPENTNFDKPFDQVDWSKVTIAGLDGEGATTAARKLLPEAKMNILPDLSSISAMLLNVADGKSDIGFVLPSVFENFNENNPGKLREAKLGKPLYTYPVGFGVAPGETEFKALINQVILALNTSGELDAVIEEYDPKGYFPRLPKPFRD